MPPRRGKKNNQQQQEPTSSFTNLPVSVGIEVQGKVMSFALRKGSSFPASSAVFRTTPTDYQSTVAIKVYIGERPSVKDNIFVGVMLMEGISRKKQRVPKIKTTVSVNEDGILSAESEEIFEGDNASAQQFQDALSKKVHMPDVNLNWFKNEIQKLVSDSQIPENIRQDKIEEERIKAKMEFESLAIQFQSTFENQFEDRLADDMDMKTVLLKAKESLQWLHCNQYVSAKIYSKMTYSLLEIGLPVIRQLQQENLIPFDGSYAKSDSMAH